MNKLLIANRGEIALRIMRTCARLGIGTVAVYSEADRRARHVIEADEAVCIGPAAVEESYLNATGILEAARETGADGIHPGYGFLSENPAFASAVIEAGLTWVGPDPEAIRRMGSKISARDIAVANDVPVMPAVTLEADAEYDTAAIASSTGMPVLLKSSAGGGGIGMREVHAPQELDSAITEAREQARRQFGNGDLLIERLLTRGRHVEVQVLGDKHGNLLHFYERDCSTQRRRQKLLEESPAAQLQPEIRSGLLDAALRLARAVNYEGAGTVEFLVEDDAFYLLEMNTRLQVEHGVTEAVCGVDLVELQLDIARGVPLAIAQTDIKCTGHAIEARIYAEEPAKNFLPATGQVHAYAEPQLAGVRIDSGIHTGSVVGHHYDGMLCKLIVHAQDRDQASKQLGKALQQLQLSGVVTNQQFLYGVLQTRFWAEGLCTTTLEERLPDMLGAAEQTPRQRAMILAAATIWQFRAQPAAADVAFWPGAVHQLRHSHWQLDGRSHNPHWHWLGRNQYQFTEPELTINVLHCGNSGELALEINAVRHEFAISMAGNLCQLWHRESGNLCLEYLPSGPSAKNAADGQHCTSHGPGQVLRILVSQGQAVTQGDPLVVIESMKMESTLVAPGTGTVAEIPVAKGELISSGQLLVRLYAHEEATA